MWNSHPPPPPPSDDYHAHPPPPPPPPCPHHHVVHQHPAAHHHPATAPPMPHLPQPDPRYAQPHAQHAPVSHYPQEYHASASFDAAAVSSYPPYGSAHVAAPYHHHWHSAVAAAGSSSSMPYGSMLPPHSTNGGTTVGSHPPDNGIASLQSSPPLADPASSPDESESDPTFGNHHVEDEDPHRVVQQAALSVAHNHRHPPFVAPRGKPEAMAKSLAAARIRASLQDDMEQDEEEEEATALAQDDDDDDDEDDDPDEEEEVIAEPVVVPEPAQASFSTTTTTTPKSKSFTKPVPKSTTPAAKRPRSKSPKRQPPTTSVSSSSSPRKKPKLPHAAKPVVVAAAALSSSSSSSRRRGDLFLLSSQPTHPVTAAEYQNLEALMVQFCRVPLLAEFSRPVSLLHPELAAAYSKIVAHPVDLGHVCRGIRRRQYKNTRDIRLDMWRVFANCVKFHSHPNNKEAVPSFVSIALHLREFFNNLWQEYMLPSDLPAENHHNPRSSATKSQLQEAFGKRQEERKRNLENSGVLVLNDKITAKTAKLLGDFIESGACTDALDDTPLFGPNAANHDPDLNVVVANLTQLQHKLANMTEEYTVDIFHRDLTDCYTKDVFEDNPSLANHMANRLNRLFWKLLIPLHEANSRGVTQSSIWGNIAATIWARESSKKPFWPALCLGILPPEDQREGWHDAVTERNEARLPEKLRLQLETAKKKCLASQKKLNLSYFLVEFLGTHEFIWVRETDIVENFDPENDPNKKASVASKKKRSSRSGVSSVVGSKTYATALEECVWANEEYESVLQDAFDCNDNHEEEADDGEEMNYSYSILSQSDDEADDEDTHHFAYNEATMTMSDIDEATWLFEHQGLLDTSAEGRKNAKKRAQALKKKKATDKDKKVQAEATKQATKQAAKHAAKQATKQTTKQQKSDSTKKKKDTKQAKAKDNKVKEDKKDQRELEKRRKKRMREREKALRSEARKNKRRRVTGDYDDDDDRGLAHDKRARASAIVKSYLTRMANDEDYKSLGLAGVMTIPAAMVDSTGLLGMALAFRAAAGEIAMPDDGEEQTAKLKPWIALDTTSAKTSAERIAALEKQTAMLKEQLNKVQANTQRRKSLAREAIAQRLRQEIDIEADDEAARRNRVKRKKKNTPRPSSRNATGTSPDDSEKKRSEQADLDEKHDQDENGSDMAAEVDPKESVESTNGQHEHEDNGNAPAVEATAD